ncbi:cyclophilin-like fold protein [Polymorphospora rubra]|uniref:cyclophilin-like fold protein n=1 Tax=Polymorphospora rubra TaxID=338584 RepID=UPI0033C1BDEF
MKLRQSLLAAPALVLILAGCTGPDPAAPTSPSATPSGVIGTVVRFTGDSTSVDVTIDGDTPAIRDFLSMLPLTVDLEEFNGREKIADLPRELDYEGTPGFDPEDGDLIYYTPWGNLGFYYNTEGIGYSDSTLRIGSYDATLDELNQLEGPGVRIEVVK